MNAAIETITTAISTYTLTVEPGDLSVGVEWTMDGVAYSVECSGGEFTTPLLSADHELLARVRELLAN